MIHLYNGKEAIQRLEELRNEMLEGLSEMEDLIKDLDPDKRGIYSRAEAYWIGSIGANLGADRWVGGSMVNFDETLKELQEVVAEDEIVEEVV